MQKRRLILFMLIALLAAGVNIGAVERKPIKQVDTGELTTETQVTPECGDDHIVIVWWLPGEFWKATFANDMTTPEADKQNVLEALKEYSLLCVCQADISDLGAFHFYTSGEIEKNMVISLTGEAGEVEVLYPLHTISPDAEVILGTFKPILSAAMGNLGTNMHFYVLNDVTTTGERVLDPYETGTLTVRLVMRNQQEVNAELEFPLNSLYIPRTCPNGRDAHISWKYCPWTGEKLSD